MTNVPVTDADREAAERILDAQTNGYCVTLMRGDAIEAIARARADADEAGYSRGLREGAASERDREYGVARAKECNGLNDVAEAIAQARAEEREAIIGIVARVTVALNGEQLAERRELIAAIRARGEGGKA